MRKRNIINLLFLAVFIVCISLFAVGGCDIDFSTDTNGSSGGNGSGGSDTEVVRGTIVDVIPDRSIEGITVEVTDEDSGSVFSSTTGSDGFFLVEGGFADTPNIEFVDEMDTSLAQRNINVFPGATVELGDIRLENGNVSFDDDTIVTFEGDVTENNCSGSSGTVNVEATNGDQTLNVLIEVDSSTEVMIDGEDMDCDALLIGDEVEVRGILLTGNNVEATRIEVI